MEKKILNEMTSTVASRHEHLARFVGFAVSDPRNTLLLADALLLALDIDDNEACRTLAPLAANLSSVDAGIALLLARHLHRQGHLRDAIAHLASLTDNKANPDIHADALGLRALLYSDIGETRHAMTDAQHSLTIVPAQPDALLALADTLLESGDDAKAAHIYQKLLTQNPRHGRAWTGLAQLHMKAFRLDDAENCATNAVQFMKNHIGTWHLLGWVHVLKENTVAARAAFTAALALEPGFADTHGGLAAVHALERNRAEAEREIRIAEKLDRHSDAVRYAKFLLLRQADRNVEAHALAQQAMHKLATGKP